MTAAADRRPGPRGGRLVLAALLLALAACEVTPRSGRCAFVDLEHLSRPRDIAGKTLICDPKRVSAAYRDRYFPGYQWGDETW